jgi:dihydropteroate synthase
MSRNVCLASSIARCQTTSCRWFWIVTRRVRLGRWLSSAPQRASSAIKSLQTESKTLHAPIPDSRFPIPDSRFPIPDSRFPMTDPRTANREPRWWQLRSARFPLSRPIVLGVLNTTPDSFSDGGRFHEPAAALAQATRMLHEGADIIDIGGESTRPQGATPVDAREELRRVLPVIRAVRAAHPEAILSIDTVKADVAAAAIEEGAEIVNDVSGFRLDARMGEIVATLGAGVILMHSRGGVHDMALYTHATYGADVTGEVLTELGEAVHRASAAGVRREAIVVDPGLGFAKRSEHSLRVLSELRRFQSLGFPVLVGASRKRFVGEASGVQQAADRLFGTVGAHVIALAHGARLFRVHDVAAARQSLDVAWAVLRAGEPA